MGSPGSKTGQTTRYLIRTYHLLPTQLDGAVDILTPSASFSATEDVFANESRHDSR
jgi:hypothetical protein